MADLPIRGIPAMTQLGQFRAVELSPGQIQKHLTVGIHAAPGHAGGIQVCRASPVSDKAFTQSQSAPQSVMHVTKDNEVGWSMRGDLIQCLRQILISPVDRWNLPVSSAGTGRFRSKTGGTAVSHHDQWLVIGNLLRRFHNAPDGLLQRDRSVNSADRSGQMKASTSAAGTTTDNRQRQWIKNAACPGAMTFSEQSQLLGENSTGFVASMIMISKDHSHGKGQACDQSCQAQIPVTEVSDEKHGIRPEQTQKLVIDFPPGTVKIPGDRNAQMRQRRCLVWCHPAPQPI